MGTFKYLDTTIEILDGRLSYNIIRLLFEEITFEAVNEFEDMYDKNGNLDKLVENIESQAATIFRNVLTNKVMPLIVELDIFNIDEDLFLNEYYFSLRYNYVFSDTAEKVKESYYEIVMDKESLDAYRVARRESRSRLVGGGFGVSGATKGILLAGAGNMVSGGVHRIANGIGSVVSSIKSESQKSKIYNDSKTKELLSSAFLNSVFNLHDAFINVITEYLPNMDILPVIQTATNQAQAILNNIESGRVNESQLPELLAEVIRLDPYISDIYTQLLYHYGDNGTGVGELAELFGFSLDSDKEILLNDLLEECNLETREGALAAKDEFEKYHRYLNVTTSSCMLEVLSAINDFDLNIIESKINFDDEISVRQALKDVKEVGKIDTDYKDDLIMKITQKIEEIELDKRTFEGIVYDSEIEANNACLEKQELLKLVENSSRETETELLQLIKQLEKIEYSTPAGEIYINETKEDLLNQIKDRKTVEGMSYLTFEEADKARIQAEKLNELLINTEDDIHKLIDLKELEISCEEQELLEAFKSKLDKIIEDKVNLDKKFIAAHEKIGSRILKSFGEFFMWGIIVRIILFFISTTWVKVILGIFMFGAVLSLIEQLKTIFKEKNDNASKVLETKERLDSIAKRYK